MADEIPSAPVAPVAPVETTPVAPVAAPVETAPVTPVVEAPSTEVAPVEVKVEAPVEAKKPETLLAQKPEEKVTEKPVEVKAEEKPTEVKVEEKAVEQPKYEWKIPEGVNVDAAKMGEFDKMLGDFQVSAKIPQEEVQKLGQQMLERHTAEMQRYTESLTAAWNKQANDWKESFLKSPEFANRTDTVLNSAIDAINIYGGDAKQQQEFRELMESSKVGNHPAMIRMLSNIMLAKAEPKPLAAPQIATSMKRSKVETMYGKKSA